MGGMGMGMAMTSTHGSMMGHMGPGGMSMMGGMMGSMMGGMMGGDHMMGDMMGHKMPTRDQFADEESYKNFMETFEEVRQSTSQLGEFQDLLDDDKNRGNWERLNELKRVVGENDYDRPQCLKDCNGKNRDLNCDNADDLFAPGGCGSDCAQEIGEKSLEK